MAARVIPSKGSKPDKMMRDALMLALNREATNAEGQPTKKLNLIAEKLTDLAVGGDVQAIREIADRVDGRPTQLIGNDPENPFEAYITGANQALDAKLDRLMKAHSQDEMGEPRGTA